MREKDGGEKKERGKEKNEGERFMSSARIDIIFYKLRHRAYSRYVDGNVSRMASPTDEYRYLRGQQKAVPSLPRNLIPRERRGIADKDSSQFTVMSSPAGKTREGNPVPRFSSRHIPNLDGDRLPFQCPALGYHAPRACT